MVEGAAEALLAKEPYVIIPIGSFDGSCFRNPFDHLRTDIKSAVHSLHSGVFHVESAYLLEDNLQEYYAIFQLFKTCRLELLNPGELSVRFGFTFQQFGREAALSNGPERVIFYTGKQMDFVVIDVETANETPSSICQIAVANFSDGKLTATWGTLVNPEDSFLPFNIRLHGIRSQDVLNAGTWAHIRPYLSSLLEAKLVASHTGFDRTALQGADRRYGLESIKTAKWIDTCSAAPMAWPHLSSYRLTYLARRLRIRYQPHDAREDARCAGEILLRAANLNKQVKSLLELDLAIPSETSPKGVQPDGPSKIWGDFN